MWCQAGGIIIVTIINIINVACMLSHFSCVQLCATLWTIVLQAPLSMGILQARILEWVAVPSSRGSFRSRDWTHSSYVSFVGRQALYTGTCEDPFFFFSCFPKRAQDEGSPLRPLSKSHKELLVQIEMTQPLSSQNTGVLVKCVNIWTSPFPSSTK